MAYSVQRMKAASNVAAVIGIGATDFGADYRAARSGKAVATDIYGYAARALMAALDDCGLRRDDIDGLIASQVPYMRLEEILGMRLVWSIDSFWPDVALTQAVYAIESGRAECVALVQACDYRSRGSRFGGPQAEGGAGVPQYYYYKPWGFSSQGAFDATVVQRYMEIHGLSHRQLGQVAVAQRAWARLNPRAIMQSPMSIEDYLNAPFVAAPLRLPDYCLVNDGGVALIVTSVERARRLNRHPLVAIKGIGWGEDNIDIAQFRPKLNFNRHQMGQAADQVYNMAGVSPADIDAFYFYDNFSGELFYTLENYGFCEEGQAAEFIAKRGIGPGGGFPVNTSGGMLSEAYMQGWNAQVEAVRQLRGEAGERQVSNCRLVQFVVSQNAKAGSIIYQRLG
ncbi:MAG TPA: thiolase family protein [Candidatus Binataceae bacterium]